MAEGVLVPKPRLPEEVIFKKIVPVVPEAILNKSSFEPVPVQP
jgi:hypothetical protein